MSESRAVFDYIFTYCITDRPGFIQLEISTQEEELESLSQLSSSFNLGQLSIRCQVGRPSSFNDHIGLAFEVC